MDIWTSSGDNRAGAGKGEYDGNKEPGKSSYARKTQSC